MNLTQHIIEAVTYLQATTSETEFEVWCHPRFQKDLLDLPDHIKVRAETFFSEYAPVQVVSKTQRASVNHTVSNI